MEFDPELSRRLERRFAGKIRRIGPIDGAGDVTCDGIDRLDFAAKALGGAGIEYLERPGAEVIENLGGGRRGRRERRPPRGPAIAAATISAMPIFRFPDRKRRPVWSRRSPRDRMLRSVPRSPARDAVRFARS